MIEILQKHSPEISMFLIVAVFVTLLLLPASSHILSIGLIVFSLGTAILFTIHSNWKTKQNDALTNAQFARNTAVDLLGLALVMGTAIWFGRLTGTYVGLAWGNLLGVVVAMAVGFIAAFLVGKVWGKVAEPMKVKAA